MKFIELRDSISDDPIHIRPDAIMVCRRDPLKKDGVTEVTTTYGHVFYVLDEVSEIIDCINIIEGNKDA